jgi:hypothetical protein
MESCITNRLNSLCVLYCNLEKKVNDYLSKNEKDILKKELEEIKEELKSIKEDNNLSIKRELEIINGELMIKNDKNYKIKDELDSIKNIINSITHELRHQINIKLKSTPNYLEYTLLYTDFENNGICMYCPSEPYEPADTVLSGPVIDNNIYTNLKNILNN